MEESSQGSPKTTNLASSAYVLIIGSCVGIVGLVIVAFLSIDFLKRRRERQLFLNDCEEDSFDPESNLSNEASFGNTAAEDNLPIQEGDDRSFDPSTIQSEKTSVWKKRMENLLIQEELDATRSGIYPQSVFNASTIKSDGSWVRRTAIPAMTQQGSVMDIDFFEEKPIPDHVMCVNSESDENNNEI